MYYRCYGAVVGDVIGSRFEFNNYKKKDFDILGPGCAPTDDSFMTVAVMEAVMSYMTFKNINSFKELVIDCYKEYFHKYPYGGYGGRFFEWCMSDSREPYNSFGNGAAMRVSPCAYASNDLDECLALAEAATAVTHNHPSALFWVKHLVTIIFNCRTGKWGLDDVRSYARENFSEHMRELDELRVDFPFDESCVGTVPVAIECVLEATDFTDAIRNAVSLGGDSDTLAAIAGSIAEPLFGIPTSLGRSVASRLPGPITMRIRRFSDAVDGLE